MYYLSITLLTMIYAASVAGKSVILGAVGLRESRSGALSADGARCWGRRI
ncbi:hypothetical protein MCBRY_000766 [Methylocystis bryophila]